MNKIAILLLVLLSGEAFALPFRLPTFGRRQQDDTPSFRAIWYCPSQNRGEMPEEKEVRFRYDENGNLKLSPDIFKDGFNPINSIRNLVNGKRESNGLGVCLNRFFNSLPTAVQKHRNSNCPNEENLICTRSDFNIMDDVTSHVRTSRFYEKYSADLTNVSEFANHPENTSTEETTASTSTSPTTPTTSTTTTTEPTTTTTEPTTGSTTEPTTEPTTTSSGTVATTEPTTSTTPDPVVTADNDRNRARLLDYMVNNYEGLKRLQSVGTHCPELVDKAHTNTYCQFYLAQNNELLNNLARMFGEIRGESVSRIQMVAALECLPPQVDQLQNISDILRSLERKDDCSPLNNVGDFKLFKKGSGPEAYTSGDYLLKKVSEDTVEATLNVNFNNIGSSLNEAQMMSKVRGCLDLVNPTMKGPNGENLRIKLLSPRELVDQVPTAERPRQIDIAIRPGNIGVNSANFSDNQTCATTVHELLHHMGLCDEYEETRTDPYYGLSTNRREAWSCRNVPSRPSIMKKHWEMFAAAVPVRNNCECTTGLCRKIANETGPQAEAIRKVYFTEKHHTILGPALSYCRPEQWTPTSNSNPDKAYENVTVANGVLTYEERMPPVSETYFGITRRKVVCDCAGNSSCMETIAFAANRLRQNPVASECPSGSTSTGIEPPTTTEASVTPNGFSITSTATEPSLLYPNQFDKIMTGNCQTSSSSLFKRCSDFAYTSQGSPECSSKPADCDDDNKLFGVRPE